MAFALQSNGSSSYCEGDLVASLTGDWTLVFVGQISGAADVGTFNNLMCISETGSSGEYIGLALDNSDILKPKIISNGKTPGKGTTDLSYNTDYTLELRYVQSTNTASFYIDNVLEYSVNPTSGGTWIPTLTKYRLFSGTGVTSFGYGLVEDGTSVIDLATPANTILLNPNSSGGTGTILPDDSPNGNNATLIGFGDISWLIPTATSAIPNLTTTAVQGFCRDDSYWYIFDTLFGSSTNAIRKIDAATGIQTAVNNSPYSALGAGTWKLNDGFVDAGVIYNPVQDTVAGTKTITTYDATLAGLPHIATVDITATGAYNAGVCKGHTGNLFFVGNGNAVSDPRNTNVTETTPAGVFVAAYTINKELPGMQGITYDGSYYWVSVHDTVNGLEGFHKLEQVGSSFKVIETYKQAGLFVETEGIEYYDTDEKIYINDIEQIPVELDVNFAAVVTLAVTEIKASRVDLSSLAINANLTIETTETKTARVDTSVISISGAVAAIVTEVRSTRSDESSATIESSSLEALITEVRGSRVDLSNINIKKDIDVIITEVKSSRVDSSLVNIPITITINPKNIIRVKRNNNIIRVR